MNNLRKTWESCHVSTPNAFPLISFPQSGKAGTLPPLSPLRTERASFQAFSSSKFCFSPPLLLDFTCCFAFYPTYALRNSAHILGYVTVWASVQNFSRLLNLSHDGLLYSLHLPKSAPFRVGKSPIRPVLRFLAFLFPCGWSALASSASSLLSGILLSLRSAYLG